MATRSSFPRGTGALSPGVQQPGHDADYPPLIIHLHGIVLNELSIGPTLPFFTILYLNKRSLQVYFVTEMKCFCKKDKFLNLWVNCGLQGHKFIVNISSIRIAKFM
jgi:hypothetical protein